MARRSRCRLEANQARELKKRRQSKKQIQLFLLRQLGKLLQLEDHWWRSMQGWLICQIGRLESRSQEQRWPMKDRSLSDWLSKLKSSKIFSARKYSTHKLEKTSITRPEKNSSSQKLIQITNAKTEILTLHKLLRPCTKDTSPFCRKKKKQETWKWPN